MLYNNVLLKVLRRLSVEYNSLYHFKSLKRVIDREIEGLDRSVNKDKLHNLFCSILGDFGTLDFSNISDDTNRDVILWANQTLERKFDYLGSGLVTVDPINWHSDFKTGFEWHRGKFYRKYNQVDLTNNADVKVPRELSRCHHLLWLGEAYLFTNNEDYAKEVIFEIANWIDENPLMHSINWCCAMDVAIRAVNWIYAANMIMASTHVTDEFARILHRSLFEHGFFIFNNLEKGIPVSNNHYAADLSGLLFISRLFLNTKSGKKWWNYALKEFFAAVREQVLPSGVHFEKSIAYHRLMTELFAYAFLMLKRVGTYIPIDVEYRIKSMFDFVAAYTKPNGLAPMISDNDDGRFLPFYKYNLRDHRYLLSLAALMYNEPKYKSYINECVIDNYFLYSSNSNEIFHQINATTSAPSSSYYQDAGFAILRKDDAFLFVVNGGLCKLNGPTVKPIGTHTHADLLSFEFAVGGTDVLVDAGAYIYTADIRSRNEFRSTKKHNTIVVDGENQFKLSNENAFLGSDFPVPSSLTRVKNNFFESCHGKYCKCLGNDVLLEHQRIFTLYSDGCFLKIEDKLEARGEHNIEMFFHFAPDIHVTLIENTNAVRINGDCLDIQLVIECSNDLKLSVQDDTVSPSYGLIINTKTLVVESKFIDELKITTSIK